MFRKKNDDTTKDENKDLDLKLKLFAELVRLWAHADAYLWNRARTIVGVQGAVLAGGWVLLQQSDHWLMAVLILAGGGILSLALFLMVKRDEQTRDYYAKFFIDPLKASIFGPPIYKKPFREDDEAPENEKMFRMIPPPKVLFEFPFFRKKVTNSAGRLIDVSFIVLIICDFLLAGYGLYRYFG